MIVTKTKSKSQLQKNKYTLKVSIYKSIPFLLIGSVIITVYKVVFSSRLLANIMYIIKDAGSVMIKINLIINEEIPKNSAIPPQTPCIDLSR